MKVAASIWSLHKYWFAGTLTNMDFVKYCSGLGIDGVELLDTFWRDQEQEIPEIKRLLDDTGLKMACYAISNNFASPDAAKRRKSLDMIKQGIEVGKELGTNIFRVFGGDISPDITQEEAEKWIMDGLAEAADYAKDHDAYLCLENHGLLVGHSDQVARILSTVNNPHLGSTFDMGNFLLAKDNPHKAVETLEKYIYHVHAKDFREPEDDEMEHAYKGLDGKHLVGTVVGMGLVDVPNIISKLKKGDYQGYLSIEFEGLEEPRFGTEASVKNLRQYLKEAVC